MIFKEAPEQDYGCLDPRSTAEARKITERFQRQLKQTIEKQEKRGKKRLYISWRTLYNHPTFWEWLQPWLKVNDIRTEDNGKAYVLSWED